MIEESYVSFEVAKLLKEKGFDETCRAVYVIRDERLVYCTRHNIFDFTNNERIKEVGDGDTVILAPTLQMTMKWLREVHNIHIAINICYTENPKLFKPDYYTYVSSTVTGESLIKEMCPLVQDNTLTPKGFTSYEEACEEAIRYCLENLI